MTPSRLRQMARYRTPPNFTLKLVRPSFGPAAELPTPSRAWRRHGGCTSRLGSANVMRGNRRLRYRVTRHKWRRIPTPSPRATPAPPADAFPRPLRGPVEACRRSGCRTSRWTTATPRSRSRTASAGRRFCPPTTYPGVGRFAILNDPQGATFAVIKPELRQHS